MIFLNLTHKKNIFVKEKLDQIYSKLNKSELNIGDCILDKKYNFNTKQNAYDILNIKFDKFYSIKNSREYSMMKISDTILGNNLLCIKYTFPDYDSILNFKPDFFTRVLADTLRCYIEKALPFTEFRLQFAQQAPVSKEEFEKQISETNRDNMRKNCKRYGVSLAELNFDPALEEKVTRSLKPLLDHFYIMRLLKEPGVMYLLLLDECQFLKELHFRAPLLEPAKAEITVYNQYNESRYRVSFDMEKHIGID